MKLLNFLHKIINKKTILHGELAENNNNTNDKTVIKTHRIYIEKVWNSKDIDSFGLLRITKLLLLYVQYITPGFWVKVIGEKIGNFKWHGSGDDNEHEQIRRCKKFSVELYVWLKVILYCIILYHCWWTHSVLGVLCIWLLSETVLYDFGLVVLRKEYSVPLSDMRNALFLLLNFIEVTLCFACIYWIFFNQCFDCSSNNAMIAVKYSFSCASMYSFTDTLPNCSNGFDVVSMIQGFVSLLFSVFLFAVFVANATEKSNE